MKRSSSWEEIFAQHVEDALDHGLPCAGFVLRDSFECRYAVRENDHQLEGFPCNVERQADAVQFAREHAGFCAGSHAGLLSWVGLPLAIGRIAAAPMRSR